MMTGTVCDMRPEVAEHIWSIWSWTTELLVYLRPSTSGSGLSGRGQLNCSCICGRARLGLVYLVVDN